MASLLNAFDLAGILLAVWLVRKIATRPKYYGRLPPGPKPAFLVGNLFDMPSYKPWETFTAWKQRWGDLVYLNLLGQHTIIINSHQAAVDLFEKRSNTYSDRPRLPSAEAIGFANTLPMTPYGDRFREQRKMLSQVFGSRALVDKFNRLQEREVHDLLMRILKDGSGDRLQDKIKMFSGAVVLLFSYGYKINREGKDKLLAEAFQGVDNFAQAVMPGAFLVDLIPQLRWIPSWFPFTGWQRTLAKYRSDMFTFMEHSLGFTQGQIAEGNALPSLVAKHLERAQDKDTEDLVSFTGTSLVGGGIDTSISTIYAFFLAMTLHPEIQMKAHEEIDRVVGSDRLPGFQDRDHLPYVNAICSELLRWMPVGPLSVPRLLLEDDEYEGYYMPKGTLLLTNLWGFLHDPERYPEPDKFDPERYLKAEPEQDPHTIAFGYGRRVCPGLHIAEAAIFICVVNVLATFEMCKDVDDNGVPITPHVAQSNASISHPEHFKCTLKPRSANAEHLIRSANEFMDSEEVLI